MQHNRSPRTLARQLFEAGVDLRTTMLHEAAQRLADPEGLLRTVGPSDTTNGADIVVPVEIAAVGSPPCLHYAELVGAPPNLYAVRRGPGRPRLRPLGVGKPPRRIARPDGMTDATAQAMPTAAPEHKGPSTLSLILSLLANVTTGAALQRQAGVSRQRVYQILHRLVRDGVARCVRQPGGMRYLWFRADVDPVPAWRSFRRRLTPQTVSVLSSLDADTVHSVTQIAGYLALPRPSVAAVMKSLTRMQLVARPSKLRAGLVTITPAGLAHPDRDAAAAKAPALDLIRILGEARVELIETMAVLGEARPIEITAAMGAAAGEPSQPRMWLHVMVRNGIAEPTGHAPRRRSRRYRLTETGRQMAEHISRIRLPPVRAELEARIAAYRAARALMWRALLGRPRPASARRARTGAHGPAQARILLALEAGPLTTAELRPHIAGLHRYRESICRTMVGLATRGAIRQVGSRRSAKVWMLAARGQDAGAAPVVDA